MTATLDEAFERGKRDGRVEAVLEEHEKRFSKINGSIDRFAETNAQLAMEMRTGFVTLTTAVRKIEENARLDEERRRVATDTLAKETERRRAELEVEEKKRADEAAKKQTRFSRREKLVGLGITIAIALIGFYLTVHYATPPHITAG